MKKVFRATVIHFAERDLADMVPPDTIARIKQKDADPQFKAFVVAHEGEATAELVATGKPSVLRYFRDAIIKIGNSLGFNTPAFYRHSGNDGTGNNTGREQIGELVGKTFKEIGGKLHAIAAFYIYPKFRKKDLKAASYEADIEMEMEQDGGVRVGDVARVTGVALSDIDTPGFPGATLMATMQAFVETQTGSGRSRQKGAVQSMENLTIQEAIAFLKTKSISPLDLFTVEQLKEVRAIANIHEKAERVEGENKQLKADLKKAQEEHTNEVSKLKLQTVQVQAQELLKTIAGERKLSPQQIAHAQKNFKQFSATSTEADAIKTELNKFVDTQLKDLDETLKALGLKPEEHGGTGWKPKEETAEEKAAREAAAGAGEGDKGAGAGDAGTGKDLADPKNNDLIPQAAK